MNVSIFSGNLGRDPELRQTPRGNTVLQFSVAVKNGYGTDAKPIWKPCELWGNRADALAKYLTKGSKVFIVATEKEQTWTSKEGEERKGLTYNVQEIEFGGDRNSSDQSDTQPSQKREPARTPATTPAPSDDIEEDVPF